MLVRAPVTTSGWFLAPVTTSRWFLAPVTTSASASRGRAGPCGTPAPSCPAGVPHRVPVTVAGDASRLWAPAARALPAGAVR
ncbi:hypothetical protein ACIBCT_19480 [Streptosporangium sp. NPDC050855]|uniref:hypothetical protein n=1 Tax=Streptosporangium sp. NPDC050855 TaxID=3366194 RepID=UPI0037B93242